MAEGDRSASIEVALPPVVKAQVEQLGDAMNLSGFGRVSMEFELERGVLQRTFLKLGPIKNQELELLALALNTIAG